MENMEFGIASVAAITVICPIACGLVGDLLGLLWLVRGWPDFPASDPLTALAVGIVSGLAATGVNQAAKQLGK